MTIVAPTFTLAKNEKLNLEISYYLATMDGISYPGFIYTGWHDRTSKFPQVWHFPARSDRKFNSKVDAKRWIAARLKDLMKKKPLSHDDGDYEEVYKFIVGANQLSLL